MKNTMTTRLATLRRRLQPLWPWLRWGMAATLALLLVLDFVFPPPLPKQRDTSTLVVAADGTPLRAFADAEGVWRYPASTDSVSPLYLQALLTYEDRWFWSIRASTRWRSCVPVASCCAVVASCPVARP